MQKTPAPTRKFESAERTFSLASFFMKAGRPAYHVRSKWVTVTTPQGVLYFELDAKGNLLRKNLHPDRVVPLQMPLPQNTAPAVAPLLPVVLAPLLPAQTPILEADGAEFNIFNDDVFDDPFDFDFL
jgi:hypothetical protein